MKHIEIPYGAYYFGDKLNERTSNALACSLIHEKKTPDRIIYVKDSGEKSIRLAKYLHRAFMKFACKDPELQQGSDRDTIHNIGDQIPTLLIVRPEIDLLDKLALSLPRASR